MNKPTARHATPYSIIRDLATTIKKAADRSATPSASTPTPSSGASSASPGPARP